MIQAMTEADHVERVFRSHRIGRDVGDEGDIFAGGETGDEVVELKDEADAVAAELRECALATTGEVPAFVAQGARRRDIQAAKNIQQGGLATAGGTEENDELT